MEIFPLTMVWPRQDANPDFLPVKALPTCYQNWSLLKPKLESNNSICDLKRWLFILPTELSCKVKWNIKIKTLFFLLTAHQRLKGSQAASWFDIHLHVLGIWESLIGFPCPCSALLSRNLYPLSCSKSNVPVLADRQEQVAEGKGGWKPLKIEVKKLYSLLP